MSSSIMTMLADVQEKLRVMTSNANFRDGHILSNCNTEVTKSSPIFFHPYGIVPFLVISENIIESYWIVKEQSEYTFCQVSFCFWSSLHSLVNLASWSSLRPTIWCLAQGRHPITFIQRAKEPDTGSWLQVAGF